MILFLCGCWPVWLLVRAYHQCENPEHRSHIPVTVGEIISSFILFNDLRLIFGTDGVLFNSPPCTKTEQTIPQYFIQSASNHLSVCSNSDHNLLWNCRLQLVYSKHICFEEVYSPTKYKLTCIWKKFTGVIRGRNIVLKMILGGNITVCEVISLEAQVYGTLFTIGKKWYY